MTKCFSIGCTQHAVNNTLWCAEHGPKEATGSTLYLIERDEWKQRALSAESKLQASDENVGLAKAALSELERTVIDLRSRLDAAHKELHDALHDQALLNRALAAESRLQAAIKPLRGGCTEFNCGLGSEPLCEHCGSVEAFLSGAVEKRELNSLERLGLACSHGIDPDDCMHCADFEEGTQK
jgi:hypothetical protein